MSAITNKRLLSLVVIAILGLAACASEVSNRGITAQLPSVENRFTGVFSTEAIGTAASFTPQINQLCSRLGGLATGPTYIGEGLFTRFFQYRCKGGGANIEALIPVSNKAAETSSQASEVKKLQAEVLRLKEIETQAVPPPQSQNKSAPPENERLSLDASKKKCTELGFKPATEGFGKCVLQLSK